MAGLDVKALGSAIPDSAPGAPPNPCSAPAASTRSRVSRQLRPRPGWTAYRARKAWHSPRTTPRHGSEAHARPTPRQAGPAAGHELSSRAHELSSKGVELLPKTDQSQPPPRAGARRAPCAPGRPRDGPTLSRSEATARRRAPARARSRSRARCGRSDGARSGAGPLVRRRRAGATSRRPTSQRALPVQTRDQLRSSIAARPRLLHRRLNGGARLREQTTTHQPSRRSRTLRKDAAMSGELPSLPSAHDMAASSAGARAHGRGLARAVLTVLAGPAPRVKGRGRARPSRSALFISHCLHPRQGSVIPRCRGRFGQPAVSARSAKHRCASPLRRSRRRRSREIRLPHR